MLCLTIDTSLDYKLELTCEEMGCQSILPKSETYLKRNSRGVGKFLTRLINNTDLDMEYTCMMDLIFCECFVQFQPACQKFYDGEGLLLKHYITPNIIDTFDEYLLNTLKIASIISANRVPCTWNKYQNFIRPKEEGPLTYIPIEPLDWYCYDIEHDSDYIPTILI